MATETEPQAAPPKKKGGGLALIIVVALIAVGAGFMVPRFLAAPKAGKHGHGSHGDDGAKPAIVPFGDAVVSLGEHQLTRYLRVKIILVVDGNEEKEVKDHLEKNKAYLKSWLLSYLSDLTLTEVARAAGVNRLRREIRDQFNTMLWPDGRELILEVLFDEFVVQ
ncbi:MAG: flagellar basal body-associated FliL family protein [Gemmataceae bacterium]